MTDRAALAARFRHAASVWKGTCLAKVDVSAEVCDLDVIADALSTPSACAGPQAEAALDRLDAFARETRPFGYARDNEAISRFLAKAREHLAAAPNACPECEANGLCAIHAYAQRHPEQPQQADGCGAVIEECAKVCDEIARAAEIRGNNLPTQSNAQDAAYDKSESAARCAKALRALQQSPATDGLAK